jgi:uncharacterized repeat protein (TIGR01451 family)
MVTWTVTDLCETFTLSAVWTLTPPPAVALTVPANYNGTTCMTQDAVNTAFDNWLAQANFTGSCGEAIMTTTPASPVAPSFCDGSTQVTWTVTSDCEVVTQTRIFTIPSSPVVLTVPDNYTGTTCMTQDAVNTAFTDWLDAVSLTGGCDAILTVNPETPTCSHFCGGSVDVTWTVNSACQDPVVQTRSFTIPDAPVVSLTLPDNYTGTQCMTQDAVNTAFTNWLNQVNLEGGCETDMVMTPENPTAPSYCGGTVFVTWTVTSECENTITENRTFTIPDAPELVLNVPNNYVGFACTNQDVVDNAFNNWLASVEAFGGCNDVTVTRIPENPVAPSFCGGTTEVTWIASSDCSDDITMTRTFAIPAGSTVRLIVPSNYTGSTCMTQTEVDAAFENWLSEVGIIGGCNATLERVPAVPTAPDHCGGFTAVSWTVTSECDPPVTLSRRFIIPEAPVATLSVPDDYTGTTCMTQDELDSAFSSWLAEAAMISPGCNGTLVTSPENPTAPDLCGGSTNITWTYESDCEETITQSRTFTIPEAPEIVIVCPDSPQIRIIKSESIAYVTPGDEFDATIISDNCGIVTMTNNLNGLSTLAGFEFPTGTTNVVWTANGICGGETTCAFDVTIYAPELYVTKTAEPNVYSEAGETIVYTIFVYNNGNSHITDIVVSDDLTGDEWMIEALLPEASSTYTTTYVITQTDVDTGTVTNVVAATGKDPEGEPVDAMAVETITAVQNPAIALLKTGTYIDNEPTGMFNAGDGISYSFLVTNSGNVTLSDINLTDEYPEIDITGTVPESLIPGESFSVSGIYILTQDDIDAGSFVNEASASAMSPFNVEVSDSDTDTLWIVTQPMLTVEKTSDLTSYAAPGEVITYTIEVSNTGNVSIFNTELVDTLVTTGPEYVSGKQRDDNSIVTRRKLGTYTAYLCRNTGGY